MYKTVTEALELANGLKRELYKLENTDIDIVVCPPFTSLMEVSEVLEQSNIMVGSQNAHWQEEGAFTAEISCKMLKEIGVKYAIIGHSERRQFFGETNSGVNKRVQAVLKNGLTPIMCVGESLEEREKNLTFKVLDDHVLSGLKDITAQDAVRVVIAYEPVWAIGTGKTATTQQAQEAHKYIRDLLAKMYGRETSREIRIQYGGSVKPENIAELMRQPDVDGALVGGASLKIDSFSQIVIQANTVKK